MTAVFHFRAFSLVQYLTSVAIVTKQIGVGGRTMMKHPTYVGRASKRAVGLLTLLFSLRRPLASKALVQWPRDPDSPIDERTHGKNWTNK